MTSRIAIRLGIAVTALLVVGFGSYRFFRGNAESAVVKEWIPARPDITGFPAALDSALAAAEARARDRDGALAGLEELSALYHANGFYDQAVHCYQGLRQLDPDNARWPHLHASILAGFGMAEQALALWEQVVELDPDYLPARLRIGDAALKSAQPADAATAYNAALQTAPGDPYALLGLARIDLEQGRDEAALRKLETVVQRSNYTLGYDLIVTLYENAGRHDQAMAVRRQEGASGAYRDPPDRWLDGLITHCYDPYRLALEAGERSRRGNVESAIDLLQRAVALDPADTAARYQLGNLYFEQRRIDEAIEAFRRCTVDDPGFADGWGKLSAAIAQTGRVAEAERIIEQGIEAIPDSPSLHRMRAHRHWARGNLGAAIADFRTAIRLRPNDPGGYIELGTVLNQQGRDREALQLFETALVYDPANPTALAVLALRHIDSGDRSAADAAWEKIINQPRATENHLNLLRQAYHQRFGELPDP